MISEAQAHTELYLCDNKYRLDKIYVQCGRPWETAEERNLNAQVLTIRDGSITLSETVKMRYGTYNVNESQTARCSFSGVSAVNGTTSGQTGVVTLDNNNIWGKVSFSNQYTRYDKWSHRDSVRNHFETPADNWKYTS